MTPPTPEPRASAPRRPWRVALGRRAHRAGHRDELVAALWLMLRGYQVLGLNLRTRQGEIDLLVRRGGVLAAVEVKRRPTVASALEAVTGAQRLRLLNALRSLAFRRVAWRSLTLRLDLMAMAPGAFPRHVRGLMVEDAPR